MSNSNSSGAPVTNQDAIAEFNTRYADDLPANGILLVLPEQNQAFEVIGHRLWRDKAYFIFAAKCMRCSGLYSFEVERGFTGLRRTCLRDLGQWSANPPPMYPKRALMEVFEANRLVSDRMLVDDAVMQAVAKLPEPTGRKDMRIGSVHRSIDKMVKHGGLGCTLEGDYFVF